MSTLLLKLTTRPNTATGKLQIRRFQPPHSDLTSNYNELGLTTVSREKPRLVYTNNLYCPAETIVESLTYIFAAGMVYLYSNFCGGSENRIQDSMRQATLQFECNFRVSVLVADG